MEVKVATTTSFHWSGRHATIPQCPSFSQILTSSKRRRTCGKGGDVGGGGYLTCQTRLKPSTFLGTQSGKLQRSKSCELWDFSTKKFKTGVQQHSPLRRVCSATSDFFSGDHGLGTVKLLHESIPGLASLEAPWAEMVNHSSIERKANSVDLPLSLKIIKRKIQEQALKKASESTPHCSIDRAFSCMVFMIEELHSFALQTRETIFYKDLQSVLKQYNKEMHASLLWIFQRVFSQTPTLMLYVMILLANFTVHSVASNLPIETTPQHSTLTKEVSLATKGQDHMHHMAIASTDGFGPITFNKLFHLSTQENSVLREEELNLWNLMVEEANRMHGCPCDHDMRLTLVSPITAKIELEDNAQYNITELSYKIGLTQEPNNPLLLANYAQFLYLVTQDNDRAEKCFKKAIESAKDVDAEAYIKYAIFQWRVRKDLWAAEENFLEAISADPTNSVYAANYANFLWQTGGEETCFPLESSDSSREIA